MADYQESYNKITNYYNQITRDSVKTLESFSAKSAESTVKKYSADLSVIRQSTTKAIERVQKKYYRSPGSEAKIASETASAINNGIAIATSKHALHARQYTSNITTYKTSLGGISTAQAYAYAGKIIALFTPGPSATGLQALADNMSASLEASLVAAANTAIASCVASLNNYLNIATSTLNSLTGLLGLNVNANITIPGIGGVKGFKTIKTNYFGRISGESSTSKYIQAIVPNAKGLPKFNPGILAKTPDMKIILPQLKFDVNIVNKLAFNPIVPKFTMPDLTAAATNAANKLAAGVLSKLPSIPNMPTIPSLSSLAAQLPNFSLPAGIVPSLIPKQLKSAIDEPKPTGDKAEYGKIIVKENKAGFVEIADETPGNERKVSLHPTGSYDQKLANGDTTNKVTGKQILIIDKNWEVTIGEEMIVIVSGDQKIEVRKDKVETIKGDSDLMVEGEKRCIVKKDVQDDFKGNYYQKISNESGISVGSDSSLKVGGDKKTETSGNAKESVGGNLSITVGGNCTISAGGNAQLVAGGIVRITGKKVMIG